MIYIISEESRKVYFKHDILFNMCFLLLKIRKELINLDINDWVSFKNNIKKKELVDILGQISFRKSQIQQIYNDNFLDHFIKNTINKFYLKKERTIPYFEFNFQKRLNLFDKLLIFIQKRLWDKTFLFEDEVILFSHFILYIQKVTEHEKYLSKDEVDFCRILIGDYCLFILEKRLFMKEILSLYNSPLT